MSKYFIKALPVWGEGLEKEKNITLGLYKKISSKSGKATLSVATSGVYKVFVNGEFVYFGPARCAHGYFRVDNVPLELNIGENHIAIEVVGYYINSFYITRQSGFIQAELIENTDVLAATGKIPFEMVRLTERIRKVQRYSLQRTFAEGYDLSEDFCAWRCGEFKKNALKIDSIITEEKKLIDRNLPLNCFTKVLPEFKVSYGTVNSGVNPESYKKDRSLVNIVDSNNGYLDGYRESELELHLSDEVQEFSIVEKHTENVRYSGVSELHTDEFEIISFPCEKTGLITVNIECFQKGSVYFIVDEILDSNGDVDPLRMECCNVIKLNTECGSYQFMAAEPMSFKYLKILCSKGSYIFKNVHITELVCPKPIINNYKSKDSELNKILAAARETFIQNSFDIFTDCPSRERAGWLCDSYFLGIAERELTGDNLIERNFLENYMLPDSFENIPHGMVSMCYPSDQDGGGFIPNWALWLILELEIYSKHFDASKELVKKFKKRVYDILDWFKAYENNDGLVERLPGWVFVEWSMANQFVQDINYPTNMMYARALEAAANLYDDSCLSDKAEKLKNLVRARSYDGEFFVDNDVYCDGVPAKTTNRTETCQYYAFFTGIANPELYPELWNKLVNSFGPDRKNSGAYSDIYPSNAFIGNILRLTLLGQNGCFKQLIKEIKGYYLYMAETTGTLWEHIDTCASCNHGFASYIAYLIRMAEEGMN